MKIQEASEDITKRKNSIPSPKTSFMEENTHKDQEKGENTLSGYTSTPQVDCCTPNNARGACASEWKCPILSPNPLGN